MNSNPDSVNKVFLKKVKRPIVFFWIMMSGYDRYVDFDCFDGVTVNRMQELNLFAVYVVYLAYSGLF